LRLSGLPRKEVNILNVYVPNESSKLYKLWEYLKVKPLNIVDGL
jgi:hypothetical protein